MDEITLFENDKYGKLRVVDMNGSPWFVASDVCTALEIKNTPMALSKLDDDERMTISSIDSHSGKRGGAQSQNVVNEPGLYTLILSSRKSSAHDFKRWITHEVIPSIRKHGAYIMPELLDELQKNTARNAELLSALASEQRTRLELEARKTALEKETARLNAENDGYRQKTAELESRASDLGHELEKAKPKATYYDVILANCRACPITVIAKDYGYSAHTMNELLHDEGIQYPVGGTWELYQKYAPFGFTHNNVTDLPNGRKIAHMCWTQKGRKFIYEHLKKKGILPLIERL